MLTSKGYSLKMLYTERALYKAFMKHIEVCVGQLSFVFTKTMAKMLFFLILCNIEFIHCGFTTGKLSQTIPGFELNNSKHLDYTVAEADEGQKICFLECLSTSGCKYASWYHGNGLCKLHYVSPLHLSFTGEIIQSESSQLIHIPATENPWLLIAKFSTAYDEHFDGGTSWELWSDPSLSNNTDECSVAGEDVNCTRNFVHNNKEWVLGVGFVSKVKISLYDNGEEVAWAIFRKLPGSEDTWFQPSRVIDSFPWDPELLRQTPTTEMSFEPQPGDTGAGFSIRESHVSSAQPAAYKHWLKIRPPGSGNCVYGKTPSPQILYSRGPGSTTLITSSVAHFEGLSGRYTLNSNQAQTFCDTNLGVPIATYDEVDNARVTEDYECCAWGWVDGGISVIPMNSVSCGTAVGTDTGTRGLNNVYCKMNNSLVGVADTMVISVLA